MKSCLPRLALHAVFCVSLMPAAFAATPGTDFPSRPVRLVVPFPPGGATDNLGRMLAARMEASLGQQVVVENRPGAGGNIGAEAAAKASPDGYTMLLTTSTLASAPSIYANLAFDPINDFRAVGEVARVPFVLVSPIQAPYTTFQGFLEQARAQPGKLSYASPGNGTPIHLYSELLQRRTGIELIHVPYKGGNQPKTDLLAGRISVMFESPVTALPSIKAGQVRALATSRPLKTAPQIPTIAASGLANFAPEVWYGLVTTAGSPAANIHRLSAALARALASPDVLEWMDSQGATVATDPSAETFQKVLINDVAAWARIVKESGAKID